jgi:hypothetical protein
VYFEYALRVINSGQILEREEPMMDKRHSATEGQIMTIMRKLYNL